MLVTALAHEDGPVAVRYPRGAGLGVALDAEPAPIPMGTSETLCKGEQMCVLAAGSLVQPAVEAARRLAGDGFGIEVVDVRFVKPLDEDMLASVWERHRLVVTCEENSVRGGLGAAVLEWAATQDGDGPRVELVGIPDRFQEHASRAELLAALDLDADGLTERLRRILGHRGDTRAQSAS
jgi:1-deoxy-D-xylulose-5-phosphate synthase